MKKINVIIFVVFVVLTLFIGYYHEPWVDEAQSWLIARDASTSEIVWEISRYEGSFPLWQLTLKLFISLGLKYEYIFIVPIFISAIGLILFLKKVEAPKYFKILFPFSFFIFYQYTIIARSYCYFFLAFSLFTINYKQRKEKTLNYILSLIFISLISLHGMIIAGIMTLFLLIENINEKTVKTNIKGFILFVISFVVETIILFPKADIYVSVSTAIYSIEEIILFTINILLGKGGISPQIYNIFLIILNMCLIIYLIRIKNKDFAILIGIMCIFMFSIRLASHHIGILYLLIMFGTIVNLEEIKLKFKHIDKLLIIILVLYAISSLLASINEYKYEYSGAESMANYIKEKGYNQEEIYGFGYRPVALLPYFEENLYKNRKETIYSWSTKNIDYYNYCEILTIDIKTFKEKPKFILIENFVDNNIKLEYITKLIEDSGRYEVEHKTLGTTFFKNGFAEFEGFTLYKLIEE